MNFKQLNEAFDRLNEKALNEGPGAGYTIKGTAIIKKVDGVKILSEEYNSGYTTYEISFNGMGTADIEFNSYYYDDSLEDVPVVVTKAYVDVSYSVVGNQTVEQYIESLLYKEELKIDLVYGGGWSHSTYDGTVASEEYPAVDIFQGFTYDDIKIVDMKITDEDIIRYIDAVVQGEFENDDYFEESLSDDIRKGNLDYDDEIDAHYKKNGNVEVQFQDRSSNAHIQRNPKDRFSKFEKHPRVSSHTWGRVWKDGNLVKSVDDSKYGTRQEIAKYLDDNELGESLKEDVFKDWKPNTSFAHIKKVYNDVKKRGYKYVNNELEEMQAAMKKVDARGYTPEQRKQIRSWHEEIWRAHKKNESLKESVVANARHWLIDHEGKSNKESTEIINNSSPEELKEIALRYIKKDKKNESLKESYDDVTSNNAFDVLYDMVELFGCEEMLDALAKAMGTSDLADNLTYICRQYDYDPNPDSDFVDESLTESTSGKEIDSIRKFTKEFCNGEWSDEYIDLVSYAVLNSDDDYKDIEDTCGYILSAYPGAWEIVEKNILSGDLLSYPIDEQTNYLFIIFVGDVQEIKIGYYSNNKNESLTEERGNYGRKGPWWYYAKHGTGPGTIPRDVNIVDRYEDDNYNTWIALDGILTTQELRDYDLKEQKPPQLFMNDLKKSNDSNYKSLVYRYAMMVVNALNDRHDEDLDDLIESIIDAMITNDEAYIILVHFNSDGYSVKSVEPEMWEEFHNDIKLAVENLS